MRYTGYATHSSKLTFPLKITLLFLCFTETIFAKEKFESDKPSSLCLSDWRILPAKSFTYEAKLSALSNFVTINFCCHGN